MRFSRLRRPAPAKGPARKAALLLLTVGLVAAPHPASADASRLDAILAAGVLRVGATGDYRPFSALEKATGAYSGFDADMARSLGAALGVEVAFVPTAWPRLSRDLESGAFDIAMSGVSITLDRQKIGFFSAPYLQDGKTPIARCEAQSKYQTLDDIDRPDVRVIVNPGGTNERFDRARLHEAKIVVEADNTTIFDALAAGGADLMITDASEARLQEKLHPGVLCAVHPDRPFDFAEKAYWMPQDPALKAFVDQWLQHHEGGRLARRAQRPMAPIGRDAPGVVRSFSQGRSRDPRNCSVLARLWPRLGVVHHGSRS